jgi:hypothetical protein
LCGLDWLPTNQKSDNRPRRISIRISESRNYPPFFCASWKELAILTQNRRKKRKNFARWRHSRRLKFQKYQFLRIGAFSILISNMSIWYIKMIALASSRWASGFHPSKNFFNPFFIIFSDFSQNLPFFLDNAFFKSIMNWKRDKNSRKVI